MNAKKIAIIATVVMGVLAVALVLMLPEDSIFAEVATVLGSIPLLWLLFCGKKYDEKHKQNKG